MNSRRINDTIDKTQLTDEEKRSSSNSYSNPINNDDSDNDNDNDNDMYDDDDISPGVFSLNKVINRFGNNVELLELILTSKVEEDRRLTEEAKLKIRQLDYQKDQKRKETLSDHPPFPSTQLPRPYNHSFSTDTLLSSSDSDSTLVRRPSFFTPNHLQQNHYYTPDSNHHEDSGQHRQNQQKLHLLSIHSPLPSINALPDDNIKKSPHFFTAPSLSASQPLSSPSPSTSIPPPLTYSNSTQQPSSFSLFSSTHQPRPPNVTTTPSPPTLPHSHKLPIPQITQSHPHHHQQEGDGHDRSTTSPSRKQPFKRRRREMQSITMIVETSEFPYNDNYNWKNNGNTVHKKSGQRSIYYKCSNAAKGCHVNKTVTCKGQDEYLIKYRGKHLKECLKSNSDPASPVNLSNTESPSASYHT